MVIDTLSLYEKLKENMDPAAAEKLAHALATSLVQIEQSMRQAQEDRLSRIEQTLERLVLVTQQHSQEIAELRQVSKENTSAIVELRQMVQENTAAIAELRQTVSGLVEITQRHSQEIAELREAVRQLVETTRKHAQVLRRLELDQQDIRKQLGGLAMAVGYSLENEAYLALPQLLKQDYDIEVRGRLKRDYLTDTEGKHLEVNILGEGVRGGQTLIIVGESKVQLSANEIDRFLRRKVRWIERIYPNLFPVIVTHMITSPDVLEHARRRGVAVYFSYDFRQR